MPPESTFNLITEMIDDEVELKIHQNFSKHITKKI